MPWQLALVIMVAANVTTTLVQRHYAQKSTIPATIPSAASYLFGVIPVGLTAGFLVFPHAISWSWWLVMLLTLCGTSMAVAGATGFRAARHLTVAANSTIGKVTSVTTVLLGWVILSEKLTIWQLVGGTILLIAALLAIWAPAKTTAGSFQHLKPVVVLLAVVASIALAIGLVTEKAILGHMEIGGVFLVGWTTQTLAMTLLATKDASKQNLRVFWEHEFKWSTLMGAVNGLTGVFYVYAIFHSDNISLITALLTIVSPLTVFGAYGFLREREHHKIMWLSLAISFVGLLVLAA
jgi:drug/metabolite transporter (DMT)-like permease